MDNDFDRILDECIDRIKRGESLEDCLANYPDHAGQLKPLLEAVLQTREVYSYTPSAASKRVARQRFNTALDALARKREGGQSLFGWLLGRSKIWAAIATVLVLALIGYFGVRPWLFPVETYPQPGPAPVVVSPEPNPEGNFVFLISDDVNAIGDFESVDVSISKIGILLGDSNGWIEVEPQVKEVDLALLPGDKTQEIWRGDVPEGQYTKVFIHVNDVSGILKETGQEAEIKLPGEKLQMSKPFRVSADTVTSFTYDLTVVATGSPKNGLKYILKPQIDQSGADQKPSSPKGNGKQR